MRFELKAADTTFVAGARRRFTYDFVVPEVPLAVFGAITDPSAMPGWIPGLRSARWVSGGPPRVGSVREVNLSGLLVAEQVLVWEPGERFTFHLIHASLPGLRRFAEDFRLSPVTSPSRPRGGATRVQWTIAWQTSPLAGALERFVRPMVFGRFEEGCRRLGGAARALATRRGP